MKVPGIVIVILMLLSIAIIASCLPVDEKIPEKFVLLEKYPYEMVDWYYFKMGMMEDNFLRKEFSTENDVYIAVIDSGIELPPLSPYHPSKILWGGNTISGTVSLSKEIFTGERHATNIISLMIGAPDGYGNVGTCFLPNCKVVSYTSLSSDGTASVESVIAALEHACNLDIVKVINLSIEIYNHNSAFANIVEKCWDNGKVVVIAAGNANLFVPYSATLTKSIVVGAVDVFNRVPFLFPVSDNITVFAPGVRIFALNNPLNNQYIYTSGTSASTALVSGAIALYLTQYPSASPDEIKDLLFETADRPEGWNYKAGILNINKLFDTN